MLKLNIIIFYFKYILFINILYSQAHGIMKYIYFSKSKYSFICICYLIIIHMRSKQAVI